jgi:peptidyl-prolyl cis-trans isomerase C
MQRVGTYAEPITEIDERLFYELHRERFQTPEHRAARHILITVNDDYPENARDAARARIERIAADLKGHIERFGELARRYSECPTATQDGNLGLVRPGQLFPQLDQCLFRLAGRGGERTLGVRPRLSSAALRAYRAGKIGGLRAGPGEDPIGT